MSKTAKFLIPSKIPRDYNMRVMKRLLPPSSVYSTWPREKLVKLLILRNQIEQQLIKNPVSFFQPNPGGQYNLMTSWDKDRDKIVKIYAAGNKAGKTTGSCILGIERALGRAVWDLDNRKYVKWSTPAVIIHFSEDFDSHKQTILPNIVSWAPKGSITSIHYNNAGYPTELEFSNGSVWRFKTYQQGADTAEGKDWDLVICDEPPPRDLYTGVFRGLVATGGCMLIAATLLKETWLYDEQRSPFVELFGGSIHDNKWISERNKEAFLASLTEDEREVRESGKPANLVGLIYKSFKDDEPFVIPDHEIPVECPIIIAVDPHERKPVHAEWAYITPNNGVIWSEWLKVGPASPDEIVAALRKKEENFPSVVRYMILDPNRGPAIQLGMISWQQVFEDAGYEIILANDDVRIGHSKMYEFLKINEFTMKPRMQWMQSCRGFGGPIFQMLRYGWADWVKGSRVERDKKEQPKQVHKDYPDCHRYVAMEDLQYDHLKYGPKIYDSLGEEYRSYGRVH